MMISLTTSYTHAWRAHTRTCRYGCEGRSRAWFIRSRRLHSDGRAHRCDIGLCTWLRCRPCNAACMVWCGATLRQDSDSGTPRPDAPRPNASRPDARHTNSTPAMRPHPDACSCDTHTCSTGPPLRMHGHARLPALSQTHRGNLHARKRASMLLTRASVVHDSGPSSLAVIMSEPRAASMRVIAAT
eukprot:364502-Chlamydomonas_euryale.AAC.12